MSSRMPEHYSRGTAALHFDPYAGISAAAALGALLDVGLSLDSLRAELAKLPVTGWAIASERATAGVTGTRITITLDGPATPLPLVEALRLLGSDGLATAVRERGEAIFRRIAAADWGTTRETDPAGTLDTFLAIVGTLIGLELLGVAEITTTTPPRGVAGSPVTPAARALLATIASERPAALRLQRVGYGLGPADPAGPHPTAVRIWLGEATGGATNWQEAIALATADNEVAGAILLVLDRADGAGSDYDRLAALTAAWSGRPTRLSALISARGDGGPMPVTAAIEAAVGAGAKRIVLQRLGLLPDPAIEENLAGIVRWARGRWKGLQIIPALPLLTGKQLASRLAGRASEARDAALADGAALPPIEETALLLIAPGSADVEGNAEVPRVAYLIWEGRAWRTVEVAFVSGATPTIADGLARCRTLGARATIALPIIALDGPAHARLATDLAAAADQPCLIARPLGTAEGFAAIVWERYREASGWQTGDTAHGHRHGTDGGHGGLAALRQILPPRYQDGGAVNSAPMPGAADLVFDDAGRVAWNDIWGDFCDLAIAGGPPHRGDLLEAPTREEVQGDPAAYEQVLNELARGLRLITGWPIVRDAKPGWIGLVCPDEEATVWILRAVLAENVVARREGVTLFLPAGPAFRLGGEIKNVISVVAKTHHYWNEHILG